MAVLFTSQDHSTQVTADRSRLRAAVESLKGRQSWRRPNQAVDKQKGDRLDPEDSMDVALGKVQQSQDTKVQEFFDNLTQYKTLQDTAKMLGVGDARRKAFVLVSEGIGKDLSSIFGAMAPDGDIPVPSRDPPAEPLPRRCSHRDDGGHAPRQRGDLRDRSARQGRVEGPRARVFPPAHDPGSLFE
jgi:hypothetical protein